MQALLDTCHSGTLLDLPHYHCNSVYVPWRSKGKRRTKSWQNVTGEFTVLPLTTHLKLPSPVRRNAEGNVTLLHGGFLRPDTASSSHTGPPFLRNGSITPVVVYREYPRMGQAKRAHQCAIRAAHLRQHPAVHRPARRARPEGGRRAPFTRVRPALFATSVCFPRVALPVPRLVSRGPGVKDTLRGLARGLLGLSTDVGGVRQFFDADRVWFPR